MRRVEIRHSCDEATSYRAHRVKSLFNVESGATFALDAELPVDEPGWKLGVIVGPSGSGKTSLGRAFWGDEAFYEADGWPDAPIVDGIAPDGDFDQVTGSLAAVGLGTVPAWLRPYRVLSNGERFRADLAKILSESPPRVVVDEFSSVVDRQIARFGALAFAKAWKRTGGQAVLLSCHYDIIDWLEPDWVFDTATGRYSGRGLWRRPTFELAVWQTDWRYWPLFAPHHYLSLPKMVAARCYVGAVDDELVSHVAFSTRPGLREARACRLVVMPEWQGAGVGLRFLNFVCGEWLAGRNPYSRPMPSLFHTSHPGLAAALRRSPLWTQVSARLHGDHRGRSMRSLNLAARRGRMKTVGKSGFGGHFRAVQGFRYLGDRA